MVSGALRCLWEPSGPIGVLRVIGRLSLDSVPIVRAALHKGLVDQPSAIVVDLDAVTVDDDIVLTLFSALARTAAGWPGCSLVLCAPGRPVRSALDRLGISRAVPVFPDWPSAAWAAAALPAPRRIGRTVASTPGACAVARDLVCAACRQWRLPTLVDDAALVVTELVSNAVRHSDGPIGLQLSLGEYFLHLAVRDGTPDPPRRKLPGQDIDNGGRGLLLVDAVAAAWGSVPDGTGKTVWATIRLRQ